ncbi:MAG TPA: HD domain-containing protein [Puia sp.]|jgi:putative nucleotidyltransferase with HDIG domain
MDIPCTDSELLLFERIADTAAYMQVEVYVIGGFVRDKLIGRPTSDADIVCIGNAIELAKHVAASYTPKPNVSFFKNFGTAHFKIQESDGQFLDVEFVGARKESYRAASRKPEIVPGTLEDDQNRRDFTINALAISLNKNNYGKLIDPFNGLRDLELKRIHTPLDPLATFSDDPLRMLRAIRFAAQLGFAIDSETFHAIVQDAERIRIISQERITEEINKMIGAPTPSVGFDLLFRSGLLQIIFPRMADLSGAEYIDGLGHKDNFYHTLQVLDNIAVKSNDLWLRWAAILHDIGKPATKKFEPGHGWTFHGHEVVGGRMVPKIFDQMKLPMNEKMRFVRKLVELHLRPISLTKENITDSAIRRLLFDAGEEIDLLMMLCEADITSKNKQKVKRYLENFELVRKRLEEVEEKDRIRNWQPPVSGEMIMEIFGIGPSRKVGDLKNLIREAILEGEIENSIEAASQYMLLKAAEMDLKPVGRFQDIKDK